jgi:DNA-binding Lrp family transcriptional regulator
MKHNDQLDETDRRILRLLQLRGDLSHAALAQEVNLSTASCWRRIQALEKAGFIGKTVRLVDPRKVGRGVNVLCQVRVKTHAAETRRNFEKFVAGHEEIMECYSMTGEWDYLLRIVVPDVASYERFLMQELLNHPTIASAGSSFALSQIKYTTALPI